MGPLRGGLILSLLASPAWAEACKTERPAWDGTPATAVSEAIYHFTSPIGLFLVAALAVAVVFRHAMGTAIVALLWSFYISSITLTGASEARTAAINEGCIGSPSLFIALSAALCLAAIGYTMKSRDGDSHD